MPQVSADENRIAKRVKTRLGITVRSGFKEYDSVVVDISQTGMCLATATVHAMRAGDKIEIRSEQIGHIYATVRWSTMRRAGVQFDMNSNTAAKLTSYFKFFQG